MKTNFNSTINITFISILMTIFTNHHLLAGTATLVRYFDTYSGGTVLSTDPAGITYYQGNLFIVDSEINETGPPPSPGYFVGNNVFETKLDGSVVYGEYLIAPLAGSVEPTGICYNPVDDFFYVTNDDTKGLYQYEFDNDFSLRKSWNLKHEFFNPEEFQILDPEGIGINPITGQLYIADGNDGSDRGSEILVVEVNENSISFEDIFSVADRITDPEGITFHESSGHLFIISGPDKKIFEYDLEGNYFDEYYIGGFVPSPMSTQGLTFAPNSIDRSKISLYIVDGGLDQSPENARIYEVDLGDDISTSVELQFFKSQVINYIVKLTWKTLTKPKKISWSVERKSQNSDEFIEIASVDQSVGSDSGQFFEYYDRDVLPGETYFYRILNIDSLGNAFLHQAISVSILPKFFALIQNFPNPFNPRTTIEFELPKDAYIQLHVYNTLGQKILTLKNEQVKAGRHQVEFNGRKFASGVYFYQLKVENKFVETKKMILIQ